MIDKTDQLLIKKARDFAIECHSKVNQLYDGLPYHTHLNDVVEYAEKFKYLLPEKDYVLAICAAWCHDTLEDGNITYNDLVKALNRDIADVVYLLTNNRGKTRSERADDVYYFGIKEDYIANYVKICDRLGNMSHGVLFTGKMLEDYKKELPHFKEMIYNDMYDDMWDFMINIDSVEFSKNHYFPKIEKFDEDNLCVIHLPKPIPFAMYNELYEKGIVRKSNLKKNHYYYGDCRNANVALWNGFEFVYNRYKFGSYFIETIKHIEDDNGFDLFVPLKEIENDKVEDKNRIKY
jgi:hypothetical protein